MPESDILNPSVGLPATEDNRPRKITCEFCECQLGKSGEYQSLSDKAKKFRKLADENEKLEGELANARMTIEDMKRKMEEVAPKPEEKKRGGLLL
jgi:predicted RNase H-like nuclease (RuvC/YqgF family)